MKSVMLLVAVVFALQVGAERNSLAREKAVLEAVIEHAIQPVAARLQRSADAPPPLVLLRDHTLGVCAPGEQFWCIHTRFALQHFDGSSTPGRTPQVGPDLPADIRAELIEGFLRTNEKAHRLYWLDSPVAELLSKAREADLRRRDGGWNLGVAALSAPGYSRDGHALVYGNYTCGTECGYSWIFLLKNSEGEWKVIDEFLIGIS